MLANWGSEPPALLGMLCAILGVVREPSCHFLGSISSKVPGIGSFIRHFIVFTKWERQRPSLALLFQPT
jgi:hypothetical protein